MALPPGWLHHPGSPADDLDLVVLLVNSFDVLADPPDRLTTIDWLADALGTAGHPELAKALRPRDLASLRRLREDLRGIFTCANLARAAEILNPLLLRARATPVLTTDSEGRAALRVAPGVRGYPALAARLPAALTAHIAGHGLTRLGTCDAAPCACVYIDRTRSATRRYCCDLCNDRVAASAYRRRKRATGRAEDAAREA